MFANTWPNLQEKHQSRPQPWGLPQGCRLRKRNSILAFAGGLQSQLQLYEGFWRFPHDPWRTFKPGHLNALLTCIQHRMLIAEQFVATAQQRQSSCCFAATARAHEEYAPVA